MADKRNLKRVKLQDIAGLNVLGSSVLDPLFQSKGFSGLGGTGQNWGTAGGNLESGQTQYLATPNADALKAFDGNTFDWTQGDRQEGTLTGYDAQGNQIGSWYQAPRESALKGMGEWAALAAAGFGGAGLLGLGPLGGALGGIGGAATANPAIGNGAFLGEAAAAGAPAIGNGAFLGEAAGLGAAGGGGTVGGGLTAGGAGGLGGGMSAGAGLTSPTLQALGGAGGTAGAAGGAGGAGGTSFWGGLAKSAIGPALSTGAQLFAANKAAGAQQDATNSANALQRYVYDTNRADNMPALQARNSALEQMQALLRDPSSLTQQPGYQFGLNEGTRTLNNGAAARGMTYSGAQGKALQRYGQDYAGTKLDQSFNRLSALAQGGQPGASAVGSAATNYGNNVSNNLTAMGDANAARYIVGGNAIGNAVNGLTAYGQRQGWWGG